MPGARPALFKELEGIYSHPGYYPGHQDTFVSFDVVLLFT
jgi:hypothetical protein